MKPQVIFKIIVVTMAVIGGIANQAYSSELSTNSQSAEDFFSSEKWTNAVTINNAVMDLASQLNWNANEDVVSDFDKQVCKSLDIRPGSPVAVSYKEVSLVIHLSKTNEWFKSSQEMGKFSKLLCQKGRIVRTNTEEECPSNYIFLFDPKTKEMTVEIDLLLCVTPIEKPRDDKYVRRSFRFAYRNLRWVND